MGIQAGDRHRPRGPLDRRGHQQRARPDAVTLLTQNVGDLHQRAGSPDVTELHGSAFRTRCTNPACDLPPFADERLYESVPACPRCGEPLRPDVVLFGETLPEAALRRAQRALDECDLFLAAGTSGTVWPAAVFVRLAAQAGARTVLVNLDAATGSEEFDEVHLRKAENILPAYSPSMRLLTCPGRAKKPRPRATVG